MYAKMDRCEPANVHARKHSNLTVLAYDGATVGTRSGGYVRLDHANTEPGEGISITKNEKEPEALLLRHAN